MRFEKEIQPGREILSVYHSGDAVRLIVCKFITANTLRIVIVKADKPTDFSKHALRNRQLELFQFCLAVVSN